MTAISFYSKGMKRYIKRMDQYKLLSKEETIVLLKAAKHNRAARNKLMLHNWRFALGVAIEYSRLYNASLDDLLAEANCALLHAAEVFDLNKIGTATFITYAIWWVKSYMYKYLAEMGHNTCCLPVNFEVFSKKIKKAADSAIKDGYVTPSAALLAHTTSMSKSMVNTISTHLEKALSLSAPIHKNSKNKESIESTITSNAPQPSAKVAKQSMNKSFYALLSTLSEAEQKVIELEFGFICENLTLSDVGRRIGKSKERTRQIRVKAIEKIKHISRSKKLLDFVDSVHDYQKTVMV